MSADAAARLAREAALERAPRPARGRAAPVGDVRAVDAASGAGSPSSPTSTPAPPSGASRGSRAARARTSATPGSAVSAATVRVAEVAVDRDVRAAGGGPARRANGSSRPGAQRERDDERGGGGEDRERGQRRSGRGGRARSARATRSGGGACIALTPPAASGGDGRGDVGAPCVQPRLVGDRAVAHRDDAVGAGGDAGVVGDEHDRLAALVVQRRAAAPSRRGRWRESRLPVGSSASRTRGRLISARAIATRCCWPPERRAGDCVGVLGDARARSAARRGAARASRGDRPASSAGQLDVVGRPRGCRSG